MLPVVMLLNIQAVKGQVVRYLLSLEGVRSCYPTGIGAL